MQTHDDFNDFKFIDAIAKSGKLTEAAKLLQVNHATVFRRLLHIEEKFGVRLFERYQGQYVLTPAGDIFAKQAALINECISDTIRQIQGEDLRPFGKVLITTTDSIFSSLLIPSTQKCQTLYPDIQLEFIFTEASLDLSQRDADIAIRATRNPPDHLVGACLGTIQFAVYQAKDAANVTLNSLTKWLLLDERTANTAINQWLNTNVLPAQVSCRFNTMNTLMLACKASLGVALLPCTLGDNCPDLVKISPHIKPCESQLWLLIHPDLKQTTRIKAVYDVFKNTVQF